MDQRLSADGFQVQERTGANPATIDQLLGPNIRDSLVVGSPESSLSVDDMLLAAELNLGQPGVKLARSTGTLGTPQLIWDRLTGWISGVGKDEALRRALKDWLKDDQTFVVDNHDDTYKQVTAAIGPSIDFIVTGHTHLERAIDRGGNRYYFNCGTWIRLLRFTDAMLKDTVTFKPVYDLLVNNQGRMELIDQAKFSDESGKKMPFVLNQTSAVSIKQENFKVVGRLTHIQGDGTGAPIIIKEFVRS